MKTSMFGTGTVTTDLRDKERNFLSFIVINDQEKNHQSYPMLSRRIDILSHKDDNTYNDNSTIILKDSGIKGFHLVVFQENSSDMVGICNMTEEEKVKVYANGKRLYYQQDIKIRKIQDFYISVNCGDRKINILGSMRDYSNRDWESYPLYKNLKTNGAGFIKVGRDEDNDLCIDNHTVSRYHGFFQLTNGKIFFHERSENKIGNMINGIPVNKECELENPSILMLGTAPFIYIDGILLYSPFNNGCELSLTNVSKIVYPLFRKKKTLLHDINMTIPGNSLVAIMGPSGSGKSTLIDLIRQNERKTSGSIKLNGIEVNGSLQFQRSMGYVHQNNLLRDKLTVYETIWYYASIRTRGSVKSEIIEKRVENILEKLNLSSIKDFKISVLSGGQKKKTAIACELVCDPQILFLDEPTSGLDPDSEEEIIDILKDLTKDKKRGKTILVITHSLMFYEKFDKVVFIGKSEKDQTGYLCYYGSPGGIFSHFNVDDNNFIEIYKHSVQIPDASAEKYKALYIKKQRRADSGIT